MNKTTLVIGASTNPERYAYKAIRMLREYNHATLALGLRSGTVEDVNIETEQKDYTGIDTVTLYVGPANQHVYIPYILKLKPKRVIFNPGTENVDFMATLAQSGIEPVEACTLVLLRSNQF